MIQLTCGACGEVQAFAEADIPPGSKTVVCHSCKSRIPVPNKSAGTVLGFGGQIAPSSPSISIPSAALPDLPAPRRPSPLGGQPPAKPAPPSGLSIADLPTPKPPAKPTLNDVSPPPPGRMPQDMKISMSALADARATLSDVAPPPPNKQTNVDLPAPKIDSPASQSRSGFGASTRLDGSAQDLPAPKRATGPIPQITAPPPPPPTPPPLPVPPTTSSQPDLLAPKRKPEPMTASRPPPPSAAVKATTTGLPPTRHPAMAPLAPAPPTSAKPPPTPASKPGAGDIDLDNMLAPTATAKGLPDLPAPKRGDGGIPNLPQPKQRGSISGLPQPKNAGVTDLTDALAPRKGATDLPAPKGFFEDLPQPAHGAKGGTDLPAPKGFFEDLPQPGQKPSTPELPAPKGFFDDLPTRARNQSGLPQPASGQSGLPAPAQQGLAPAQQGVAPAATARGHQPSAPPTADDLFNDLTPPPQLPPALDLDDLDLGPGGTVQGRAKAGPSTPPAKLSRSGLTPGTQPPASGSGQLPMLDLGDADAGFAGVDLPSTPPLEPPASGVSFKAKPGSQPGSGSSRSLPSGEVALDIEDVKPKRNKRSSGKTAKAEAAPPRRRSPILLVSLLLVAGAGAGGFYFFRTWKAKQDRAAIAKTSLDRARAELVAGRWNTAGAAAQEAIDHGAEPGEAYGIAAQASYAGALDEGTRIEPRFKTGSRLVNKARELTLSGPDIAKADGLKALADGKAQLAVDRLGKMPPNDHNGQLYQGWARHAAGDHQGAIDAFERSIKANPKRDLPALYGRARARLALGDREAAKADFALVLERVKDHLGAQLGLAIAAATPTELAGREQALLALLGHKDIDKADQRLVAEAWTVAGDDASHASRTDAARDHYRKALQKDPLLIAPLRGLAVLEMREGKLDAAADVLAKAQKIAPDDVALGLVDAELALRTKNLVDAEGKLHALRERKPPITDPAAKARLFLLTAELHLAKAAHDDALAACEDALATAAPEDIEVPLAAASMLGQIADKAPDNAAKLRERADEILEPLAVRGKKDAQVALSLGVGYLAAGNPEKAETWLRQVIAARPQDIDAHFQLAEALSRQGKRDEALAILRKAYELEPTRTDVGVQLARRYEEAGRYEDATAMYDRLLAGTEVTVDMRGRAGRFFARRGKPDKARAQGEEILSADPRNAAGLFLRGFGLLADGKAEEAKRRLQEAVDLDPDPQYLEALGLALELMYNDSKEERFRDDAIRIYGEAVQADPRALAALSGQGRMLIARRDGEKAVVPLLAANKLWPDNADLEFNIGIAYQLAEKPKEAIEWQARSLKKKRRAEAFLNVGTMYYEQTNYRQAAVFLFEATVEAEKAIKAGAPAPEWLTGAYYRLGDAHSNLRHNAAACRAWRKYLDTNPTDTVKADGIKRELLRVCD